MGRAPDLALAGAATLFGSTFLVTQDAVDDVDPMSFLVVRFGFGAAVLLPPALVTGSFDFPAAAWASAAYTGVVVGAVAFGLQVWGQRRVSASRAALVLMLELVVAAGIGGLAGGPLGVVGAVGAGFILAGILV